MPIQIIYVAALLLVIGVATLPYGYYTFLRIVSCAVFVIAAKVSYDRKRKLLPWAYGVLALLFNPIIKVHLPKEIWGAIDVASAIFLLATSKIIQLRQSE